MVLSDAEILNTIQNVFNTVTGRSDIQLKQNTKLNSIPDVNSFTKMELIMNIEETFDIELNYTNIAKIKKIRDLIIIIKELKN